MFHKRLLKEFKDNQKYVIGMVLTQWISLVANVVLMLATVKFLETLLFESITYQGIGQLLLILCGVLCMRGIATSINSKLSFKAATNVKIRLRDMIYQKLMRLGAGYRSTIATSEAVQISTEGVEQLEIYFAKYVPQFFYSLLAPVTLFVIVGSMSLKVAAILLICVPLIPVSIVAVQKFAKKLLNKYWGTYTELGDSFLESLQALTTLKIYQADERYAQKMDEEAEKFRKITMKVLIMQLNSISVMDLVAYGGAALGIILSIFEFRAGAVTFAECLFIILISAEFFLPLRLLGSFFHIAMNGNAAANKIFALLDAPEKENGSIEVLKNDEILIENVSFSYEGAEDNVLNNVSLKIPAHKFTALVGESGCGKSTIVSLIMKELTGYKGSIQVGETELSDIKEEALYHKITRITHESYLFKGTVEENLRMGKEDADSTEMEAALKQVDLYETVMGKGGLSMQIEEKGANLSGGQKQRLALARAILHDSDIYIFDEATSNVDVESENRIMEVVRQLAEAKSVILISHRLANIVEADRIFVMEKGCISEQGTHKELLEKQGCYKKLYQAQQELESYSKNEEKQKVREKKERKADRQPKDRRWEDEAV